MSAAPIRITHVMPREQVGAKTGRKYEVQYEEAALACLKLLEEGNAKAVYCEWHDDFVIELHAPTLHRYAFHQVKTRSDNRGAWSMFEILGVRKPREPKTHTKPAAKKAKPKAGAKSAPPKPVKLTLREGESIAMRMLDHHRKFKDACAMFMLVTSTEVASDPMFLLVKAAKSYSGPSTLPPEHNALFAGLLQAHKKRDATVTEEELWALLVRLDIVVAQASEPDPRVAIGLMGQLIYDLSEVDLTNTEQRRVADALLKVVRERSHAVLASLPSEAEVQSKKAVALPDVIRLLPLSMGGYERLRKGERQTVRTLSRLRRLCQSSGMSHELIETICDLKLEWGTWRATVGDSLTSDVHGVLREAGIALLGQLTASAGSATRFQDLQREAEAAATRLAAAARMPGGLTANIVMGLVFALAAETE